MINIIHWKGKLLYYLKYSIFTFLIEVVVIIIMLVYFCIIFVQIITFETIRKYLVILEGLLVKVIGGL